MESAVVRAIPLTKEETKTLVELIENSDTINIKSTNATNNKLKNKEWIHLTRRFNATSTCAKTPHQLRLKWENLKKSARKRNSQIKMNYIHADNGLAEYIPPNDVLDRVSNILGSAYNGPSVPFEGDKDPEFIVCDAKIELADINDDVDDESSEAPASPENVPVFGGGRTHSPTPNIEPERLTFTTPRDVEIKITPAWGKLDRSKMDRDFALPEPWTKLDRSKMDKNFALAKYYKTKKLCLDAKLNNILLQNEKLTLENEKLKLELDKLKNN